MEKPTFEFLSTLGQYVYKYVDDEGKLLYVGKGNGTRCLAHLDLKNYSLDHCYIVARNLERFEEKKDWQSFLLESYLIATETPIDNSVSGHYKECFVMTSLSSMFSNFKAEQHDNFAQLPDWYIENYEILKGKLRLVAITSGNTYFESNTRNSIKMSWYWNPGEEAIKVTFEVFKPDGEELENIQATLTKWLKQNKFKDVSQDGKKQKLAVTCAEIPEVLSLFMKFST